MGLAGGSWSTYSFAKDNPLRYEDPSGLNVTISLYKTNTALIDHIGIGVNSTRTYGFYGLFSASHPPFKLIEGYNLPGLVMRDTNLLAGSFLIKITERQDEQITKYIEYRIAHPVV